LWGRDGGKKAYRAKERPKEVSFAHEKEKARDKKEKRKGNSNGGVKDTEEGNMSATNKGRNSKRKDLA